MILANKAVDYMYFENGGWETHHSHVIVEVPVSLTVNGESWMSFMCSPVDLDALAVGFLYNEGLIDSIDDIEDVRICQNQDNVDIWTRKSIERPVKWRHTSGCTGGVTSVEFDQQDSATAPVNSNGLVLTPRKIVSLVAELFKSQELYKQAGGVHTSAMTDGNAIFLIAEDIGRHNTLDKIAGHCLINGININPRILITTGRISSEMLQKATRLQAFFLISRTSPTSLSISLADRRGITLIGYARRDRFKVYTHPERIVNIPEPSQIPSQSDESQRHEP